MPWLVTGGLHGYRTGILMNIVRAKLHSKDPYVGFDAARWPLDLQGWNDNHPLFASLIQRVRPSCIIEVGTWKGASAIHMAQLLRTKAIVAEVICVDTFLGWPGAPMPVKHGFPLLYGQFLANVLKCGLADIVTPFPQTSDLAALWFESAHIKAGLVYIDGAHGFGPVYEDLVHYWPLVELGGCLFGDDYSRDDVRRAVNLFAKACGVSMEVEEEKWLIWKRTDERGISAHEYFERQITERPN